MQTPVLILGSGKSNQAVGRFFTRQKIPFVVSDTRNDTINKQHWNDHYGDSIWWDFETCLNSVNHFSTIVVSPGISLDNELVQRAFKIGLEVIGELEIFARHNVRPVIAITGTNGKSTVTRLVEHTLQNAGFNAVAGGNIGLPGLDLLLQDYAIAVLEISSFQLESIHSLQPQASVLLNIGNDHLDRHGSHENYLSVKERLLAWSKISIVNDSLSLQQKADITFSAKSNTSDYRVQDDYGIPFIYRGNEKLIRLTDLQCNGEHNVENIMAAWALVRAMGLNDTVIANAIRGFKGLKHRCELLGTLDGVQWINDSKGTNVEALVAALSSFSKKNVLLIAGGQAKGQQLYPLEDALKRCVKKIFAIGEDGSSFLEMGVEGEYFTFFEEALSAAHKASVEGDVVLLSPACSSLDMFKDFEHRGQIFTEYFQQLCACS